MLDVISVKFVNTSSSLRAEGKCSWGLLMFVGAFLLEPKLPMVPGFIVPRIPDIRD